MLKVIDLFSGCGGFAQASKNLGWDVVFSCEIDKYARQSYEANFEPVTAHDILDVNTDDIPDADMLVAGFPCPAFSIAGISSNNYWGHASGFDHAKGELFFQVLRILKAKRPRYALLENVKNLFTHNKGKTFEIICEALTSEGYHIKSQIATANKYVPQSRPRIYIMCFRELSDFDNFVFPVNDSEPKKLYSVLQDLTIGEKAKYTLSNKLWGFLKGHKAKHKAKGNGFGFQLFNSHESIGTLTARYYKDGSEALIDQIFENPRKLTPRECASIMGFSESYKIVCSDTQTYKQFGNSVIVPLVEEIMAQMSWGLLEEELADMLAIK